jgi:hypothetical protein
VKDKTATGSGKTTQQYIAEALEKCPTHLAYLEQQKKFEDVQLAMVSARRERDELLRSSYHVHPRTGRELEAEEFLKTGSIPEGVQKPANIEMEHAERKVAITTAAVEVQKGILQKAEVARAREVGPLLRPFHQRQVALIGLALESLSKALKDEQDFREEMLDQGLGFYDMRPLGLCGADMRMDVEYSTAWLWFKDARENGYRV